MSLRRVAVFVVVALGAGGGPVVAKTTIATPIPAAALRTRTELTAGWTFRKVAHQGAGQVDDAWLPAIVPGCVHTDLFAAGKIGDPFYRLNEKDQQWIENESWEYRATVPVDAATLARERVELVFAGLDTFADVFVNGAHVLTADNMFRSWRADVKSHLKPGDNQVVVRFASPIAKVKPAYDKLGYKLPAANDQGKEMVSMWARKAPYHYGWDWGPRFVTSGIWRPVALEVWDEARLDDVQTFQNKLDAGAAEIGIVARVVAARAGKAKLTIGLPGGPVLGAASVDLKPGVNDVALGGKIAKPELWWPNGLGPQKLYTIETKLADAGGAPR
ncbi:MAG TPA: sugar-binding domain-containing protein, partial [Polyangia bacterium]